MNTLAQVLDRIEEFTETAFGWLETNLRRVVERSTTRRGRQRARPVQSHDPDEDEVTRPRE